jgi:hypothetical protein
MAAIAAEEAGRVLADALGSLLAPTPRAVLDGAIVSRALFAREVRLDEGGASIALAAIVVAPPGPSATLVPAGPGMPLPHGAPGAADLLAGVDPGAPAAARAPESAAEAPDVALVLAPEAISQALHEAWRAGLFHVTLDGAALAPLHPLGPDAATRLRRLLPGAAAAIPAGARVALVVAPGAAPSATVSSLAGDGSVEVEVALAGLGLEVRVLPPEGGAPVTVL